MPFSQRPTSCSLMESQALTVWFVINYNRSRSIRTKNTQRFSLCTAEIRMWMWIHLLRVTLFTCLYFHALMHNCHNFILLLYSGSHSAYCHCNFTKFGFFETLWWYNDHVSDELATWQNLPGGIPNRKIVTQWPHR